MPQQERCPPCVDDFLYICDDAYKREELIAMEVNILSTLKFDINIPIPYRFLRRFAKVGAAGGWAGAKVVALCWLPTGSKEVWARPPNRAEDAGVWQAWGVRSVSCAPEAAL